MEGRRKGKVLFYFLCEKWKLNCFNWIWEKFIKKFDTACIITYCSVALELKINFDRCHGREIKFLLHITHTSSNDHNKLINKGKKHKFHICSTSCALMATKHILHNTLTQLFVSALCEKNRTNCNWKKLLIEKDLTFSFQQFSLLFVCCTFSFSPLLLSLSQSKKICYALMHL